MKAEIYNVIGKWVQSPLMQVGPVGQHHERAQTQEVNKRGRHGTRLHDGQVKVVENKFAIERGGIGPDRQYERG